MAIKYSETLISTNLLSGTDFLWMKPLFLENVCYPHRKSVPESRFVEISVCEYFIAIEEPYPEREI